MHEIDFKPSRRLGLLLGVMSLLAAFAVVRADLPAEARLALVAALGVLAAHGWKRPQHRLRVMADGRLQWRKKAADEWDDVEVFPETFVSPVLIVLRYRSDGEMRTLTLLPDSADAESLRRLRVSLRWARHRHSDTSSPDVG